MGPYLAVPNPRAKTAHAWSTRLRCPACVDEPLWQFGSELICNGAYARGWQAVLPSGKAAHDKLKQPRRGAQAPVEEDATQKWPEKAVNDCTREPLRLHDKMTISCIKACTEQSWLLAQSRRLQLRFPGRACPRLIDFASEARQMEFDHPSNKHVTGP
jgi:hypothetical protein